MLSNKRRVDAKGRSASPNGHIRLQHWVLASDAWNELKPAETRVLIELYGLYNGRNNGDLFLSCRQAAKRCKINKDTAARAFKRLQDLGFIRRRADEPKHYSLRQATCWILTEFGFYGLEPTKDFMRWRPPPIK
jgi:Helix-turn-helix domain